MLEVKFYFAQSYLMTFQAPAEDMRNMQIIAVHYSFTV